MPRTTTPTPEPDAPALDLKDRSAGRHPSNGFPNIMERDVVLIEHYAASLALLARALRKGDKEAAKKLYVTITKLPLDAERIRVVARRALARTDG